MDASTYDVVLLAEQPLSQLDARQVHSLHEAIADPVRYHLLLPAEDAATRVEAAVGTLGTGDPATMTPTGLTDERPVVHADLMSRVQVALDASLTVMRASGAEATGRVVTTDPVDALVATAAEVGADEAIVLTRPHVTAEFFHVDWTSKARRKLGVPVLHLLEHENFDEQAGGGEGISGF